MSVRRHLNRDLLEGRTAREQTEKIVPVLVRTDAGVMVRDAPLPTLDVLSPQLSFLPKN